VSYISGILTLDMNNTLKFISILMDRISIFFILLSMILLDIFYKL